MLEQKKSSHFQKDCKEEKIKKNYKSYNSEFDSKSSYEDADTFVATLSMHAL